MIFGLLKKFKGALSKTGALLGNKLRSLFQRGIDEDTIEELEELFYEADLGVKAAARLTEKAKTLYKQNRNITTDQLIEALKLEMTASFENFSPELAKTTNAPLVILIVGVNGNGKTTSTAKLAAHLKNEGKKVLIAAADTFRAAAIDQLEIWTDRLDIDLVKGKPGGDAAAVTFDAISAAKSRGHDVVLVDTAGRLHTKTDLMQELAKIKRTCEKVHPESPQETLLILDATFGQNAIDQAKVFNEFTPITGLILTKLDGTAKGGIVFQIQEELKVPIKFIGVGEGLEDLQPFDAQEFTSALFD
jgi:fused signal recognition particle receptor